MEPLIKFMIKEIHLASKDISGIYANDVGVPKFITYPMWFIFLLCIGVYKGLFNGKRKNTEESSN